MNHWIASEGATGGAEEEWWPVVVLDLQRQGLDALRVSHFAQQAAQAVGHGIRNTRVRYVGIHTAWEAV